ncbi:MAG: MFS transporter, partial [Duncaniella sp.]|nr:MFS transporter [Duncaniella sp.]
MSLTQSSSSSSDLSRKLRNDKGYYWFLVTYLVILSALGSFVNDMYSPALPAMCRFFGCSVPLGQMGLTMGMIGLSIGQLVLGPVSDRYGRKPVLIGAVSLFIVAAVASVFSPTIHVFNTCRL